MLLLLLLAVASAQTVQYRVISVPVVDLRAIPEASSLSYECCNEYQQTQVLYGECVQVLAVSGDWLQVQVPDQLYLNGSTFVPYPGFVMTNQTIPMPANYSCDENAYTVVANQLAVHVYGRPCTPGCITSDILFTVSLGTRFIATGDVAFYQWIGVNLPTGPVGWVLAAHVNMIDTMTLVPQDRVQSIITTAHTMLGWVYFWGGRSAYNPYSANQLTGVDCSGLTGIAHQTNGILLPRDASGQFFASKHGPMVPIYTGSLFFFASSSGSITHVMYYIGDGNIIESTRDDGANGTRLTTVEARFGAPVQDLKYGQPVGSSTLYWGNFLSTN